VPEVLQSCIVNNAGPAADSADPVPPAVYINLTDSGGTFVNQWFYAAENSKSQMLAVALTAISLQTTVACVLDPPNPGNNPYTQIYRLYLNAVPPIPPAPPPPPPIPQLLVTLRPQQLLAGVPTTFTVSTVDSITGQPVATTHVTINNYKKAPDGTAAKPVKLPGVGSPITASGITFYLGKSFDPATRRYSLPYDKLPTIEVDAPGYSSVSTSPDFVNIP
jgi:hypothetical protein